MAATSILQARHRSRSTMHRKYVEQARILSQLVKHDLESLQHPTISSRISARQPHSLSPEIVLNRLCRTLPQLYRGRLPRRLRLVDSSPPRSQQVQSSKLLEWTMAVHIYLEPILEQSEWECEGRCALLRRRECPDEHEQEG